MKIATGAQSSEGLWLSALRKYIIHNAPDSKAGEGDKGENRLYGNHTPNFESRES
jgi:hypothetical protein